MEIGFTFSLVLPTFLLFGASTQDPNAERMLQMKIPSPIMVSTSLGFDTKSDESESEEHLQGKAPTQRFPPHRIIQGKPFYVSTTLGLEKEKEIESTLRQPPTKDEAELKESFPSELNDIDGPNPKLTYYTINCQKGQACSFIIPAKTTTTEAPPPRTDEEIKEYLSIFGLGDGFGYNNGYINRKSALAKYFDFDEEDKKRRARMIRDLHGDNDYWPGNEFRPRQTDSPSNTYRTRVKIHRFRTTEPQGDDKGLFKPPWLDTINPGPPLSHEDPFEQTPLPTPSFSNPIDYPYHQTSDPQNDHNNFKILSKARITQFDKDRNAWVKISERRNFQDTNRWQRPSTFHHKIPSNQHASVGITVYKPTENNRPNYNYKPYSQKPLFGQKPYENDRFNYPNHRPFLNERPYNQNKYFDQGPYNQNDFDQRPYNQNHFDQRPYNQNHPFDQRPYNQNHHFDQRPNNQNHQFDQRPYNQNHQFDQRPYGQDDFQTFPRPYRPTPTSDKKSPWRRGIVYKV